MPSWLDTEIHRQYHEVASLFPLMEGTEYQSLIESVKSNGLREPILLYEDKILDGRNRHRACIDAKVKPHFEQWAGDDPWECVWDMNAERRHLPEGQKVCIYLVKESKRQEWHEARRKRQEEANRARSEAAQERPRADDGTLLPSSDLSRDKSLDEKPKDWSHRETADKIGVSPATAGRAEALFNARPDLVQQVADGDISLGSATRQKKKDELVETDWPDGKFRILYADPPWKYSNSGDGIDDYGPAERHYPAMSMSKLCALGDAIKESTLDDAVLFLWVTSSMLEDSFKIIKAWGFKYKTSFVWDKVKHNFGHYNSVRHEFLLICTRGSCTPDVQKLHDSVQVIERSDKHSEKPEEFRQIIDEIYPHGPRLELFSRTDAEGWETWGNEPS
jgi:N6-adenosine-specific RNA methylase IME4